METTRQKISNWKLTVLAKIANWALVSIKNSTIVPYDYKRALSNIIAEVEWVQLMAQVGFKRRGKYE